MTQPNPSRRSLLKTLMASGAVVGAIPTAAVSYGHMQGYLKGREVATRITHAAEVAKEYLTGADLEDLVTYSKNVPSSDPLASQIGQVYASFTERVAQASQTHSVVSRSVETLFVRTGDVISTAGDTLRKKLMDLPVVKELTDLTLLTHGQDDDKFSGSTRRERLESRNSAITQYQQSLKALWSSSTELINAATKAHSTVVDADESNSYRLEALKFINDAGKYIARSSRLEKRIVQSGPRALSNYTTDLTQTTRQAQQLLSRASDFGYETVEDKIKSDKVLYNSAAIGGGAIAGAGIGAIGGAVSYPVVKPFAAVAGAALKPIVTGSKRIGKLGIDALSYSGQSIKDGVQAVFNAYHRRKQP